MLNRFRYVDWGYVAFNTFIVCVILMFCAFIYDVMYQGVRSEHKVIACAQKQMEAHRLSFTDSVICTPAISRRDTLYIQGDANAVR
jgi:hypothetical protein